MKDCTAVNNEIIGIVPGAASTITGNTVAGSQIGILGGAKSLVTANLVSGNNIGIRAFSRTLVRDNNISDNGTGIEVEGDFVAIVENLLTQHSEAIRIFSIPHHDNFCQNNLLADNTTHINFNGTELDNLECTEADNFTF